MKKKCILIGGAGFIGTNATYLFLKKNYQILVIDSLTYAGNLKNINPLILNKKILFKKVDISNFKLLKKTFFNFKPDLIINFAAESHVDRSIDNPFVFFNTNILGVYNILEIIKKYNNKNVKKIKFFQVSTDEVYGSVKNIPSTETSFINPSSPYSSTKAASDAMIQGWCKTFNIEYYISRCTNNFGPYQYPEKFIPITLFRALNNMDTLIYGNGKNIRDWIYVDDHISAIYEILKTGKVNNIYNIGAGNEVTNNIIINKIFKILKKFKKNNIIESYLMNIKYVNDRPAHDLKYSLNINKIKKDTFWKINKNFDKRLEQTVLWYVENPSWINKIVKNKTYVKRIGNK